MNNFSETANFLWSIADLIRDVFKRGKYQDVILPFTVLRRIDSVLAPTKTAVLQADTRLRGKLDNIDRLNEYRTALISAAVTGKIDMRGEA